MSKGRMKLALLAVPVVVLLLTVVAGFYLWYGLESPTQRYESELWLTMPDEKFEASEVALLPIRHQGSSEAMPDYFAVTGQLTEARPVGSRPNIHQMVLDWEGTHGVPRGTFWIEWGYALGYQAVAYYTQGVVVVDPGYKSNIYNIVNHEMWHLYDYWLDGRIHWGEVVPPR